MSEMGLILCFSDYEQVIASAKKPEPLKIMISGAPASGKGTQCELITQKVRVFFFPSKFVFISSIWG